MQLSEFRDLLANDGFAATFQTMGQYRTELLRALDGLRAQADARPVAWRVGSVIWPQEDNAKIFSRDTKQGIEPLYTHPEASTGRRFFFDDSELDALYEAIEWAKDEGLPGTAEHLQAIFDAHDPEASAPGLSDEEIFELWCSIPTLGGIDDDIVPFARALLTRASVATVGEAGDARDAARYRKLRHVTGANRNPGGGQYFNIPSPPVHVNILQGSVAQHLDAALDAWETGVAELDGAQQQAEPCPECNGSKTVTFAGDACPVCAQQAESSADAVGGLKAQATITLRQAESLLQFFGGHDAEVAIAQYEGGLIAWCTECPEEGSFWLGKTEVDDELADKGRPQAAQQQSEPGADERVTEHMNLARTVYAIRTQHEETERRDWFNVGFKEGFNYRAAQSGQRGTPEQILTERKLTCEAIEGAIAFGYQNTNPPPSDNHWLAPFWKIGRKQSELEQSGQRAGVKLIGYWDYKQPGCIRYEPQFPRGDYPEGTLVYIAAAQSGQRAGVAEDARDILYFALAAAEDQLRRVAKLIGAGHDFIDRGRTLEMWADMARETLRAAAPTQQQEGV